MGLTGGLASAGISGTTSGGGTVTSVFTRTGAVVASSGDYTAAQVTNAADKSSASAQVFTGNVQAPAIVSASYTSASDQALQPTGVSNSALVVSNAASAVSGLKLIGEPANSGTVINAGTQLNVQSSDTNSSLVISPKGAAHVQVVQSPQAGGVIVATSTDNNTGRYGSGMFNGCMQIFRPSNTGTRDPAMPWLLMGKEDASERWTQGVQTSTPPGTGTFTSFLNSVADDVWLRGFGLPTAQQTIRIGVGQGASGAGQGNLNGSILDIAPGINGNAGTLINGVTVTGAVSGSAPSIAPHTIPTITGQTGDTNVGLTVSTIAAGLLVLQGANTGAGVEVYGNSATGSVVLGGNSNFTAGRAALTATGVASGVNGITATQSVTGTGASIAATGGDTNVDLLALGQGASSVRMGNSASAVHVGIGVANAGAFIFGNSGTGDGVIFTDSGNPKIHFGASGATFSAFQVSPIASGVNGVRAFGNTTGNPPGVLGLGTDTNVDFWVAGKGTGGMYIPDGAGGKTGGRLFSVTGVPSSGIGSDGDFAFRKDTPGTTNQRLYVHSAGSWVGIL